MSGFRRLIALSAVLAPVSSVHPQQPIDSAYTARIRELTPTDKLWKFTTGLVDYRPASATVPTPLKVLGYVPGSIGRLSYTADINRYFRARGRVTPGQAALDGPVRRRPRDDRRRHRR